MKRKASAVFSRSSVLGLVLVLAALGCGVPAWARDIQHDPKEEPESAERRALDETQRPFGEDGEPEDDTEQTADGTELEDGCESDLEDAELQRAPFE